MESSLKKKAMLLGAAMLAGSLANPAASQEAVSSYPSKPIVMLFNSVGTSSMDTEMRLYQNALKGIAPNMTLVFDYKGGAGGIIGTVYVARQKPDGYTYLATSSNFLSVPFVNKDAGYDVFRDFESVTEMSQKNFMLLIRSDAPFKTVNEYVDYARANPGKLNWGTSGEGSSTHVPGLLLHSETGTQATFIHYKGSNDRLIDLMANRVDVTVGTVLASMSMVKAGKMRAIAVTSRERSPLLPDLPTFAESGLPGLEDYDYSTWLGLLAPAKTPAPISAKFVDLLRQAGKEPFLKKSLYDQDALQVLNTSDQFRKFLVTQHDKLSKALKSAGLLAK